MDIQAVKDNTTELQKKLLDTIVDYEEKTKVSITSIDLERVTFIGGTSVLAKVTVKVELF